MKLLKSGLMGLLCVLVVACTEKETPGGVTYKVIRKGDGVEAPFGQFLVINMELKDSKDSVWFSTIKEATSVIVPVPDASMEKDEGEYGVFKQLTKGDSISFQLSAENVFTKTRRRAVPKNVDPKSLFKFNVGLKDVWNNQQVQEFRQKMMEKDQRDIDKQDSIIISNYLTEKGIVAKSTPSGIRYIVKQEGKGPMAVVGNTSYVHYAGYLLNGALFDTSLASVAKENSFYNQGRNTPYPVVVGTQEVIRGWDEMLQLMNKGMKARVFIPSGLAYGPQGNGPLIPGNSVLVFDLEVIDIK